jgi:mono/diheme cytochrome c family protein
MRLLLTAAATGLALATACQRGPSSQPRDALQEAFREDGLTAVEAQGHRLFLARCATCHGPQGRGDGQNAYNLDPPPPDFQESLAKLSVADRRRVVEGGTAALGRSPLCPSNGRSLTADEIDAVVSWLDVAARRPLAETVDEGSPRPLRRRP